MCHLASYMYLLWIICIIPLSESAEVSDSATASSRWHQGGHRVMSTLDVPVRHRASPIGGTPGGATLNFLERYAAMIRELANSPQFRRRSDSSHMEGVSVSQNRTAAEMVGIVKENGTISFEVNESTEESDTESFAGDGDETVFHKSTRIATLTNTTPVPVQSWSPVLNGYNLDNSEDISSVEYEATRLTQTRAPLELSGPSFPPWWRHSPNWRPAPPSYWFPSPAGIPFPHPALSSLPSSVSLAHSAQAKTIYNTSQIREPFGYSTNPELGIQKEKQVIVINNGGEHTDIHQAHPIIPKHGSNFLLLNRKEVAASSQVPGQEQQEFSELQDSSSAEESVSEDISQEENDDTENVLASERGDNEYEEGESSSKSEADLASNEEREEDEVNPNEESVEISYNVNNTTQESKGIGEQNVKVVNTNESAVTRQDSTEVREVYGDEGNRGDSYEAGDADDESSRTSEEYGSEEIDSAEKQSGEEAREDEIGNHSGKKDIQVAMENISTEDPAQRSTKMNSNEEVDKNNSSDIENEDEDIYDLTEEVNSKEEKETVNDYSNGSSKWDDDVKIGSKVNTSAIEETIENISNIQDIPQAVSSDPENVCKNGVCRGDIGDVTTDSSPTDTSPSGMSPVSSSPKFKDSDPTPTLNTSEKSLDLSTSDHTIETQRLASSAVGGITHKQPTSKNTASNLPPVRPSSPVYTADPLMTKGEMTEVLYYSSMDLRKVNSALPSPPTSTVRDGNDEADIESALVSHTNVVPSPATLAITSAPQNSDSTPVFSEEQNISLGSRVIQTIIEGSKTQKETEKDEEFEGERQNEKEDPSGKFERTNDRLEVSEVIGSVNSKTVSSNEADVLQGRIYDNSGQNSSLESFASSDESSDSEIQVGSGNEPEYHQNDDINADTISVLKLATQNYIRGNNYTPPGSTVVSTHTLNSATSDTSVDRQGAGITNSITNEVERKQAPVTTRGTISVPPKSSTIDISSEIDAEMLETELMRISPSKTPSETVVTSTAVSAVVTTASNLTSSEFPEIQPVRANSSVSNSAKKKPRVGEVTTSSPSQSSVSAEGLAYLVVAGCCSLSVLCLGILILIIRWRKYRCTRRPGDRTANSSNTTDSDLENSSCRLPQRLLNMMNSKSQEASTHKLGSWFSGRSAVTAPTGSNKHRGNMAFPSATAAPTEASSSISSETGPSKTGSYILNSQQGSLRGLLSLSSTSDSSRTRLPGQESDNDTSDENPSSSEFGADVPKESALARGVWRHVGDAGLEGDGTSPSKRKISTTVTIENDVKNDQSVRKVTSDVREIESPVSGADYLGGNDDMIFWSSNNERLV